MTLNFDGQLATLFTAYKKTVDDEAVALYGRGLTDIPLPLLDRAIARAIRTRTWLPAVAELRADAEAERQVLLKEHPWKPCAVCRDSEGWVAFTDTDGVARVKRCGCFDRYRAQLAALGVTDHPVLALPAASEVVTP